jgi:hypothetical protein
MIQPGGLRGQFGYSPTSPTAQYILDGTYDFRSDIDEVTKELFVEIAQIRSVVPPNSVTGIISRERWQQHCKKVMEDTSLSQSGLHFGHYIAGADCNHISQFHALRVSLALKKASHWSVGQMVSRHARKNVWSAFSLQTRCNTPDGGELQCDE